jgi:hypothetical protein
MGAEHTAETAGVSNDPEFLELPEEHATLPP